MKNKFNKFLKQLNLASRHLVVNCIKLLIRIKEAFSNIGNLVFLTFFLLSLIPLSLDFKSGFYFLYIFVIATLIISVFVTFVHDDTKLFNSFRIFLSAALLMAYPVKCTLVLKKEEEKESKEILEFLKLNKEEATDCKKRLLTQDKHKIRDCIKILKEDNYY